VTAPLKDLSGNLEKFRREWTTLKTLARPHWQRLAGARGINEIGRAWTNLCVESARISPYLIGHFDAIERPASLLSILGLLTWGLYETFRHR